MNQTETEGNAMQYTDNQSGLRIDIYRSPGDFYSIAVLLMDPAASEPYVLCNARGAVRQITVDEDGFQERAVTEYLILSVLVKKRPAEYQLVRSEKGYKGIVTLQGSDGKDIHFGSLDVDAGVGTRTYETEQDAVGGCVVLVSALGGIVASKPYGDYFPVVYPGLC